LAALIGTLRRHVPVRRLRGADLAATIHGVSRLSHGYTNRTRLVQNGIEKRYQGADPFVRAQREFACLTHLLGKYEVPEVVEFDISVPVVAMATVAGRHGQELIAEGHAPTVLRLIGQQLAKLQTIDSASIPGLEGVGDVIVHGDFGPQNIICSLDVTRIAGVLDWESAHVGSPIEDLAWAEWIVRMHHPEAVVVLPELFDGSGLSISWSDRRSAMIQQCRRYIAFCEASEWKAAAAEWRRRLTATGGWHE
jgi:tRNA A-37 threonylcarbamoyl transferase component Bud32